MVLAVHDTSDPVECLSVHDGARWPGVNGGSGCLGVHVYIGWLEVHGGAVWLGAQWC